MDWDFKTILLVVGAIIALLGVFQYLDYSSKVTACNNALLNNPNDPCAGTVMSSGIMLIVDDLLFPFQVISAVAGVPVIGGILVLVAIWYFFRKE